MSFAPYLYGRTSAPKNRRFRRILYKNRYKENRKKQKKSTRGQKISVIRIDKIVFPC